MVGTPGKGVAGFRRTHRQALAAQRIVEFLRQDSDTPHYFSDLHLFITKRQASGGKGMRGECAQMRKRCRHGLLECVIGHAGRMRPKGPLASQNGMKPAYRGGTPEETRASRTRKAYRCLIYPGLRLLNSYGWPTDATNSRSAAPISSGKSS